MKRLPQLAGISPHGGLSSGVSGMGQALPGGGGGKDPSMDLHGKGLCRCDWVRVRPEASESPYKSQRRTHDTGRQPCEDRGRGPRVPMPSTTEGPGHPQLLEGQEGFSHPSGRA